MHVIFPCKCYTCYTREQILMYGFFLLLNQIVEKGRQEAVNFYNNEQEEKRVRLEKEGLAAATDMELSDAKFLEASKDA